MCHGDDSHPPLPPIRGAAGDYADLELQAADGNRLGAFYAHPDKPSKTGMVVMPDVRGLHGFYKELAIRFAETGMQSVAIDYFGRTAGIGSRDEGFEFMPHVQQMKPESARADVAAGVEWLRSPEGGGVEKIFTVGFCMGGSLSWAQSASGLGLAGCIGFYGQPGRVRDLIPKMEVPLLLLIAGQDFTPLADFEAFDKELSDGSVEHEMKVYPEAPHSFFDRGFEQHAAACDDAWTRILGFVAAHS